MITGCSSGSLATNVEGTHVVEVIETVTTLTLPESPVYYPAHEGAFTLGRDVMTTCSMST